MTVKSAYFCWSMPRYEPRRGKRYRKAHNIEFFAQSILKRGGQIGVCGVCMDARGLKNEEMMPGAEHSTLEHLAEWTEWADKVRYFNPFFLPYIQIFN